MSARPIVEVPVSLRGRPKFATTPLDQRVTVTVTPAERARVNIEAAHLKSSTMSGLLRSRGLHTIDLAAWRKSALSALDELRREEAAKSLLRRQIFQAQRDLDMTKTNYGENSHHTLSASRGLHRIRGEYEKLADRADKREARVIGRFTSEEYETIIWRAQKLSLTLSDYLRIMLFDFLPGQADKHMSPRSRKDFYDAVININEKGWGSPPVTVVEPVEHNCPNCGQKFKD